MISVIISSKNHSQYQAALANISETIGVPFEAIPIENYQGKFGICEAYNLGARQSKYEILCFMHEDILFHTQDWGKKVANHLADSSIGLIGIHGNTIKTAAPSGVWVSGFGVNRTNHLQRTANGGNYPKYENPLQETVADVVILDGMWLCCRKEIWEKNHFDEKLLRHFHGYDIDFSLQVFQQKRVCVVYDILLEHFSGGGNTVSWAESAMKVAEKWSAKLPLSSIEITPPVVAEIEYVNLKKFCNTLIDLNYDKAVTKKYLSKILFTRNYKLADNKLLVNYLFGRKNIQKLSQYFKHGLKATPR